MSAHARIGQVCRIFTSTKPVGAQVLWCSACVDR